MFYVGNIMAEATRGTVALMLKGIDRYNPANLSTLEHYVEMQAQENIYDLEANLAVLKLYQFNPNMSRPETVIKILLKALTNLPHTDFILCKCLLDQLNVAVEPPKDAKPNPIFVLAELHNLLETCQFKQFWVVVQDHKDKIKGVVGFEDSIRKFICHVVNITYQHIEKSVLQSLLGGLSEPQLQMWMNKYGWRDAEAGLVYIANQEDNVKTKNITEKIDFESVAAIMASSR